MNFSVVRSSAGKVVESSVALLGEYTKLMMDSVFSSVDQCPGLLRMALRQLWARVAERFTGAEHAVRNSFSKKHLSHFSTSLSLSYYFSLASLSFSHILPILLYTRDISE